MNDVTDFIKCVKSSFYPNRAVDGIALLDELRDVFRAVCGVAEVAAA